MSQKVAPMYTKKRASVARDPLGVREYNGPDRILAGDKLRLYFLSLPAAADHGCEGHRRLPDCSSEWSVGKTCDWRRAGSGSWKLAGEVLCRLIYLKTQQSEPKSVARDCLTLGMSEGRIRMDGKKLAAEAIGTFWLTFGGCGSAVIAAGVPQVGIGMLGVALAFGLTVLTMAYAIGHISGCHLNPAVTVGLTCGGRFPPGLVLPYVIAQVVGAIVGAAVLYVIASGSPDFSLAGGFAANGYGDHSPGKYGLGAGLLTEVVLTMMFLFVIMGSTHGRAPTGFAPIAIGLALTLIHLISIRVTNTSVNPARSTGPALFVGGWALSQLWLFWVAPLIGGAVGGLIYRWLSPEPAGQVTG
jgi:aquaporin Z